MKHRLSLAAVALATAALGACSPTTNPVRDVFTDFGAGPPKTERADFVQRSRPADLDYIPVGRAANQPSTAARSAEDVKKLEAEMDAVRARNEAQAAAARRAGGTAAPPPRRTP